MTQQKKTTRSKSAGAKVASSTANKAAKTTAEAVASTKKSAENVINIGSRAAKDLLQSGAGEAQKAQDKIMAIGRDGAEQMAKSADAMTKAMYESINSSRENMEAAAECSNVAAALAKDISGELMEYANKNFSDSVELSKQAFACRTMNDVMELQNRAVKNLMDASFNQSNRLASLMFEYSAEAFEPINERVAQATEQFSKTLKSIG